MKRLILLSLQNCRTMEELKQIHAHIFKAGLHQDQQTLNKLMAFCTDPSLGCFRYSKLAFDFTTTPSLFVYNLMIKAYTKSGSFSRALFLFRQLREKNGLFPDSFTYPYVLKSVGCSRDLIGASMLHGFAMKTGMVFDNYVSNSFIDAYGLVGCVHNAGKLFDEMPERDTVSWNVLISGLVRCKMFEDAVAVFRRMRSESDLRPDEATIVSALSACAGLKLLELGREIHGYVKEEFHHTPIICNALVDMYCKCGCLGTAREIFEKMSTKSMVSWTSMISGYVNCGELDEAMVLFESSPEKDVILWTAMINGCLQFNRYDQALRLFQEMQLRRVRPDSFTLVTLLTGCIKMGAYDIGKQIHNYIEGNGIVIDTVLGTALIEMYAKCGCIDKSLEIFSMLEEKDKESWTSIICGLAMNGRTENALEAFAEMERGGPRPDHVTFVGVLSACNHGGLVEEGREHFNSMKEVYHIEPTVEHYTCMVDLLGRAGYLDEAADLIRKSRNESDGTDLVLPLYSSLLRSCRTHGSFEVGERVAKWLVEMDSKDPSVGMLLSNIYADVQRWEDATKVRRSLKPYRDQTVPGYSSIEVGVAKTCLI